MVGQRSEGRGIILRYTRGILYRRDACMIGYTQRTRFLRHGRGHGGQESLLCGSGGMMMGEQLLLTVT